MSSRATRRCSRKTNEKRVKRICFRVTTAPFREPRSLGSRVDSRKINLSCRKTPSSTKSRRAPTRAPPIILIGGTPVTSRRRRKANFPSLRRCRRRRRCCCCCARVLNARALYKNQNRSKPTPWFSIFLFFLIHAASICASWSVGRYSRSTPLRLGWRSLRSALASIWRMRSRVTLNTLPISSSVFTRPSSKP